MHEINIGSNSASSSCSSPMEGHPKAMLSNSSAFAAEKSEAVNTLTSAPAAFAPSATLLAMISVFPVPLQYTTAVFITSLLYILFIFMFYVKQLQ